MASSVSHNSFSTIPLFVGFLVVASSLAHVLSSPMMSDSGNRQMKNHTFKPAKDIQKLRRINAYLKKINKPTVKTIQAGIFFPCHIFLVPRSPDDDIIDCVLSHLQPAFDHPELRGQKPQDPPARPKCHNSTDANPENLPEGTVPIRRSTEKDVLRASSIRRYGRTRRRHVRRDSTGSGHEYAVVFVNGDLRSVLWSKGKLKRVGASCD
ncbi:Periplasmic nitrate reductase [Gossypium australe]|uniref:Periplasmic nitrate reductase n=1 Tax=Gossypium australe TaxID=47621 RepID=A0A5B6W496_9ROSI|nr:Periplasmic nitrate reductase [Gossypium australe]